MVKNRLILQLQQKEIAALEEIIQTYHNYVAKNVGFFALGKGITDRYK